MQGDRRKVFDKSRERKRMPGQPLRSVQEDAESAESAESAEDAVNAEQKRQIGCRHDKKPCGCRA